MSSVSVAPQMPVRRILALTTTDTAMSSLPASDGLPAATSDRPPPKLMPIKLIRPDDVTED